MARRLIDPAKWSCYSILSHPHRDTEHINLLEVRAAHLMLRWRSRTAVRTRTPFFHFLDSQAAQAVLCKGRSSSRQMNRLLKRIGALPVATEASFRVGDVACCSGIPPIRGRVGTKVGIHRAAPVPAGHAHVDGKFWASVRPPSPERIPSFLKTSIVASATTVKDLNWPQPGV